jgi:hypothetical protein
MQSSPIGPTGAAIATPTMRPLMNSSMLKSPLGAGLRLKLWVAGSPGNRFDDAARFACGREMR